MRTVWKVVVVNVSAVVGFVIAALVVPPETPDKVFVPACLGALVLINAAVLLVPRLRKRSYHANRFGPGSKAWFALLMFLLVIALTWWVNRGH